MEILFLCVTELGFHRDFVHVEVFCVVLYCILSNPSSKMKQTQIIDVIKNRRIGRFIIRVSENLGWCHF